MFWYACAQIARDVHVVSICDIIVIGCKILRLTTIIVRVGRPAIARSFNYTYCSLLINRPLKF